MSRRRNGPHKRATDGVWEQWITLDGRRYKREGTTRQIVVDKIAALRVAGAARRSPAGPMLTIADAGRRLLDRYPDDSETRRVYGVAVAHWEALLGADTRIDRLTPGQVKAAVEALVAAELEPATVRNYAVPLRLMLADRPDLFPALKTKGPKRKQRVMLDKPLVGALLAAAHKHPLGISVGLGFYLGLRAGEIPALRRQDVDLDTGIVSINGSIKPSGSGWTRGTTKSGDTRYVTAPPPLIAWVRTHLEAQRNTARLLGYPEPESILADPATGQPISRDRPTEIVRALLRPLLVTEAQHAFYWNTRNHDLRHLHISILVAAGVGAADIAARAGHASTQMTLGVYAHALGGNDARAAEVLGRLFPTELTPDATMDATPPPQGAAERRAPLTVNLLGAPRSTPQQADGSAAAHPTPLDIPAAGRTKPPQDATPHATLPDADDDEVRP